MKEEEGIIRRKEKAHSSQKMKWLKTDLKANKGKA